MKNLRLAFEPDKKISEFKKRVFYYKYYLQKKDYLKTSEMAFNIAIINQLGIKQIK